MARRRAPEAPPLGNAEGAPAELLVGRLVEAWAEDPSAEDGWRSAWRRWDEARSGWLRGEGLMTRQGFIDWHATKGRFGRALLDHAPWSIAFLDGTGRSERVDERLARAGVRREDVPELRRRALARLAELPRRA